MGISNILNGNENLVDLDPLDYLPPQDKSAFLTNTRNLIFVCGNKTKPNDFEPNPFVISFGVRRALVMKNYTRLPVIIVVNNRIETSLILEQFHKLNPCFKIFVSNNIQRRTVSDEIVAEYQNEADFILTTYDSLWDQSTNKDDPSSVQIILINPLREKYITKDVSKLDVIFGCIHRHKRLRPCYSFILDEAHFPVLSGNAYQYFLNTRNSIFFRCNERKDIEYTNPFKGAIPFLTNDQIQLFILRELFRGKKLIKELVQEFKWTFTYKLYLYSNKIYPSIDREFTLEEIKEKNHLDQKVFTGIVKQLHLFTKGINTKSITAKVAYNDYDLTKEQNNQDSTPTYLWNEIKETTKFLPIITKKDGRYKLSALGEEIFNVSSRFYGVEYNFSELLAHFSRILYKNKDESHKFSVKEIIIFYLQLIGCSDQIVKEFEENIPEKLDTERKNEQVIDILEKKVKPLIKQYHMDSAKKILNAFEKLMDVEAQIFLQQFIHYGKEKKRSWEEIRIERILQRARHEPLAIKPTADYYHMFWQETKKLLEKLVDEGNLVRIATYTNRGKSKYKYLTQELLDANPHLRKNCGNCQWYNKRFKTCVFLRLKQAKNPSTMKDEEWEYANGKIKYEATACEKYKEKSNFESIGDKVKFTITIDKLTEEMLNISSNFFSGDSSELEYLCLSCREKIEEFGSRKTIFFPKNKVTCPNCSSIYLLLRDKKKVKVKMEERHHQRSLYYKETGTIVDVLKVKEPARTFVIDDITTARVKINEERTKLPYFLEIENHDFALDKVKSIYFSGIKHQELEKTLRLLAELEPERFNYKVARIKKTKMENEIDKHYKKPFSDEDYSNIQKIIKIFSNSQIFNHQFLDARHLSNIAGMLLLKHEVEVGSHSNWRYDFQLLEMIDLLVKVKGGEVKSSYYGTQLEALSNNYLFDFLKREAMKANLWTEGRVNSRLVNDLVISFNAKTSNAFSPFDALLNQMLKSFRAEVDLMFYRMGLDPAKLGPGLFHRRKTKSDIDKLGFYFDLIEVVRVLVLVTTIKAIKEEILDFNDCEFVLGEDGQEIYQIKSSSLEKFTNLVKDALERPVSFGSETEIFQKAFEFNLLCLKVAFERCLSELKESKRISLKKIKECFDSTNYKPLVFYPIEIEEKLQALNRFANKKGLIFNGIEELVLNRKREREEFREEIMNHWFSNKTFENTNFYRLTKHQNKEQNRSLLIILLLLFLSNERNYDFGQYSTSYIKELLGLTQNQTQRILDQMVSKKLLVQEKVTSKNDYQLNLENENVKDLGIFLDVLLTRNEVFQRELVFKIPPLLEKISKITSHFRTIFNHIQKIPHNNFWLNWKPTSVVRMVIDWVEEKTNANKTFFKLRGDIHGN